MSMHYALASGCPGEISGLGLCPTLSPEHPPRVHIVAYPPACPMNRWEKPAANPSHRLRTSVSEYKPVLPSGRREAFEMVLDELLRQPRLPQAFDVAVHHISVAKRLGFGEDAKGVFGLDS